MESPTHREGSPASSMAPTLQRMNGPICGQVMRIAGSAIRAWIKQKKRCRPIFFKIASRSPKESLFAGQSKPAFSFILIRVFVGTRPSVATRSVSHLVLARTGAILFPLPNSNRRKRAETGVIAGSVSAPPGSVFLRPATHYPQTPPLASAALTAPGPTPEHSPRPENFQCRDAFIQFQRVVVLRRHNGPLSPTRL